MDYLGWDNDGEVLVCSNCNAEFEEDGQGVLDWCYCPNCGCRLSHVDDPSSMREYADDLYRSVVSRSFAGRGV